MSQCPHCGFAFEGLAANCPSCGRDLKVIAWSNPVSPRPPSKSLAPRILGIVIGAAIGLAIFAVGFYIDFVANFCLDFAPADGDDCAGANQNFTITLLFVVFPVSIAVGIGSGVWITRLLRRRSARPPS